MSNVMPRSLTLTHSNTSLSATTTISTPSTPSPSHSSNKVMKERSSHGRSGSHESLDSDDGRQRPQVLPPPVNTEAVPGSHYSDGAGGGRYSHHEQQQQGRRSRSSSYNSNSGQPPVQQQQVVHQYHGYPPSHHQQQHHHHLYGSPAVSPYQGPLMYANHHAVPVMEALPGTSPSMHGMVPYYHQG